MSAMSTVHYDSARNLLLMERDLSIRNQFELRMLEENRIEGLLPLSVCDDNGILRLAYDTAGLEPLSSLTDLSLLRAGDLRLLLLTLKHVISGMEPFLLDASGILLSPDTVFLESGSRSPRFLYLPCRSAVFADDLSEFLKALMSGTDHNDYPGMVLAYRLYRESLDHPGRLDRLEKILIAQEESPIPPFRSISPEDGPVVREMPEGASEKTIQVEGRETRPDVSSPPVVLEVRESAVLPEQAEKSAGLLRRLFHKGIS